MSVQDASGTDNANFATPPDGQSGQCRMYIWDYTSIKRDGALEVCFCPLQVINRFETLTFILNCLR